MDRKTLRQQKACMQVADRIVAAKIAYGAKDANQWAKDVEVAKKRQAQERARTALRAEAERLAVIGWPVPLGHCVLCGDALDDRGSLCPVCDEG